MSIISATKNDLAEFCKSMFVTFSNHCRFCGNEYEIDILTYPYFQELDLDLELVRLATKALEEDGWGVLSLEDTEGLACPYCIESERNGMLKERIGEN